MEQLRTKHRTWIKEFLVLNLIGNQKLIACKKLSEHIVIQSVEIRELSLDVAFMVTICYFVKISVKVAKSHVECDNDDSDDEKIFDIVVKFAPEVEPDLYEKLCMHGLFSNEINAYEYVIPKIESLSKSPKCYYSHNKFLDAVIALSDFSTDGWQMSKSKVNLSIDHILIAVKELGRFHGNMYALKLTDADTFNSIKSQLVESRFGKGSCPSDDWNLWLELSIRRATNSVRASKTEPEIVPESFLKRLEHVLYGTYDYQRNRIQPIEPIAIICHGDYLRNNIAFRYDDDGKAVEAMMFDFQTIRYSSPMVDLCTFIANSTGWEVRDKHFWDIFAAYHKSLIAHFLTTSKWDECDIPTYLKYDSFLEEYARYLPFGLTIASSFLQTLHVEEPLEFAPLPVKEIVRKVLDKGGDVVDAELRAIIIDIYRLHDKLNLTLEKL
ncbi:uncharacterized protein LOC129573705 [Sitodiplosis mosellana]|uniref:uncharacterized protein LOC129573705 n=1 Tax=Sitodiplosis mosellana TaxID=263140 RepID=UPI002444B5DE|nr:uncharacterized protein LOC129573705 [Sitodiplosis mosellana]